MVKSFGVVPAGATQTPEPFELQTSDQKLNDFKTLLRLSPVARETYENSAQSGGKFGVTREWMLHAKNFWENHFDWRKQELHINSFPNFKSQVKDEESGRTFSVHFAALFSERKDAIPLVFLHGWPGSFLEFLPIMDLLRKKYSSKDLPYHVIAPSLLGYTLSEQPPTDRDWKIEDTARVMHKLCLSLGFGETGYVVQGGDIGSYVSRAIAATYSECKAMHLNFMMMIEKPASVTEDSYSEQEKYGIKRMETFQATGTAYGRMHATRPATIGHVLASSPMAQLAWIGEKFLEWTDEDLPLDVMLTDITLYWLCESFPSSIYTYREDFSPPSTAYYHGLKELYVDKPTGYSYFPQELIPIPKSWAETTAKLVHFNCHERGGHFAALEKPEELWSDIEAFLKLAWKSEGDFELV